MAKKNLGTRIDAEIEQLDYVYKRVKKNVAVLKRLDGYTFPPEIQKIIEQEQINFIDVEETIEDKIDSTASNLEKYYSGVERIFESIAKEFDKTQPEGDGWHQQLLKQMLKAIPGKRNAVISEQIFKELGKFKDFRNFEKHNYLRSVNPKIVINAVETSFIKLHQPLMAQIKQFANTLPQEMQAGNEVTFEEKQQQSSQANRKEYLTYKAKVAAKNQSETSGYFGNILQQEKTDIAIAKLIFQELANNPNEAEIRIKQVISQSDRTLKLKENLDKEQVGKYLDKILAQAKSLNKPNINKKNTLEQ